VDNVQYTFITEKHQEHLCQWYSFQVSAVNAVGEGNRSSDFECPSGTLLGSLYSCTLLF